MQAQTPLIGTLHETEFGGLPASAVQAAKVFLLDALGIGVAGRRSPWRNALLPAVQAWGEGTEARVLGDSLRLPPASAAFVNGFQMHCQEFDAVHEAAVAHLMTPVAAAAMAELDSCGQAVSGQQLILALCRGVEIAARLGIAATSPLKFFRPATVGIFGAGIALASLRKLEASAWHELCGYALAQAAGTMQAHDEGRPTLPIQIANAARHSFSCADLAVSGIPSTTASLTGKHGYLALFEDTSDPRQLTRGLGQDWHISRLAHKPFPSGRATHGGLDLVRTLMEQGLEPHNLEWLELHAPPLIHQLVIRPARKDMDSNYARLCFPYCAATFLRRGRLGLDDFDDASLGDPDTLSLAGRIQARLWPLEDPAAFTPQRLKAKLSSGTMLEAELEALPGSHVRPLSREQCLAKAEHCLAYGFEVSQDEAARRLKELTGLLWNLEKLADAKVLLNPLTQAPGTSNRPRPAEAPLRAMKPQQAGAEL